MMAGDTKRRILKGKKLLEFRKLPMEFAAVTPQRSVTLQTSQNDRLSDINEASRTARNAADRHAGKKEVADGVRLRQTDRQTDYWVDTLAPISQVAGDIEVSGSGIFSEIRGPIVCGSISRTTIHHPRSPTRDINVGQTPSGPLLMGLELQERTVSLSRPSILEPNQYS